jgi:hypothetical protein
VQIPDWSIPAALTVFSTGVTITATIIAVLLRIILDLILKLFDYVHDYINREIGKMWAAISTGHELPPRIFTVSPHGDSSAPPAMNQPKCSELPKKILHDNAQREEHPRSSNGRPSEELQSQYCPKTGGRTGHNALSAQIEKHPEPVKNSEDIDQAFWDSLCAR